MLDTRYLDYVVTLCYLIAEFPFSKYFHNPGPELSVYPISHYIVSKRGEGRLPHLALEERGSQEGKHLPREAQLSPPSIS